MRGLLVCAVGIAMMAHANAAPATPDDVVAAEREFAADGQARGWIAAFKRYAAPDAIAIHRPERELCFGRGVRVQVNGFVR